MTNEELKEKIMKIIDESVDAWAIRDKCVRIHVHIDKLADALIAAGIGDVKEAEIERKAYEVASNQYRIWFEEQKDRAEVAENALDDCVEYYSFAEVCPVLECNSNKTCWQKKCISDIAKFFKKQAEKELAEEGKMTEQSKEAVTEKAKLREEVLTVLETLGNNLCDFMERAEALREENEALIREADENAALAMQHKMRADDLAKENAELKARLEKAVELPCRIGDTLYGVYNDKVAEYIVIGLNVLADWTLEIYLKTQNKKQNRFSTFSTSIGVRYFKDREAAETKLAELKGE